MLNFSIIIPTYRRQPLLARCLEALAPNRQGIKACDYEVIVADDERSPETAAIVKRLHLNFRYIEGPACGAAANRNRAASLAAGEWLVFTDDDCIPQENWLSSFAAAIRPSIEIYEGKTTCKAGFRSPLDCAPANETGGYLWSCNMMIGSALFRELGGFDEGFGVLGAPAMEDVDLRERLRDRKYQIPFVPSAVVDHPPRRLRGLGELITGHKYLYRFQILKRREIPNFAEVAFGTAKTRLRACLRPDRKDLPRALFLFGAEMVLLTLRAPVWQWNYKRMANRER